MNTNTSKILVLFITLIFLTTFTAAQIQVGVESKGPKVVINPTTSANTTVNNSFYWQGYTPTTLPHNILQGLQGGQTGQYYHLTQSEHDVVLNLSNISVDAFVPYQGATQNVNLGGYNLTASSLLIPTGGQLNFRSDNQSNNSYIYYNIATKRVELWVNNILQQDWGNSTTIYGKATFQADAFFQNLSGEGLFINTNVIVDGYIKVFGNATADNIFAGNICYSDGTNCTAFNSTLGNLTSLIYSINQSLTNELNNKLNITDQRYNETALINSVNQSLSVRIDALENSSFNASNYYTINQSDSIFRRLDVQINASEVNKTTGTYYVGQLIDSIIDSLQNAILNIQNLTKKGDGNYLYNDTTTIYFNETKLNQTVRNLAEVKAYTENISVVTSGGEGFGISAMPLNFLITELIVTPSSGSTQYRFEANETGTGNTIDTNRIRHTGVWDIYKNSAITNQTVSVHIINSNPAIETFNVQIKFIDNFYP